MRTPAAARGYAELCRKTEGRRRAGPRLLISGSGVRVPDGPPTYAASADLDSLACCLLAVERGDGQDAVEGRCGRPQVLGREMRVPLDHRQRRVAQQPLQPVERHPALHGPACERVRLPRASDGESMADFSTTLRAGR